MPAYNTAAELPHKGFLTVDEAARVLGVNRRTVLNHISKRRLGALRRRWWYGNRNGHGLRSAYFIPVAELKRFLMRKVVEKYAKPTEWLPPDDGTDAIMELGR